MRPLCTQYLLNNKKAPGRQDGDVGEAPLSKSTQHETISPNGDPVQALASASVYRQLAQQYPSQTGAEVNGWPVT